MSVLQEILDPLTLASFVLDYRLEGDPLQVIAKRFSHPEAGIRNAPDSCNDVTLIMTGGVGCSCELWLPTIKHLFKLQSQSNSSFRVRHAWAVEWPNHGDAAVLNESVLKESYPDVMTQRSVAIALRRLIASGLVDVKTSKIVGLGHSAGAGAHIISDPEIGKLPFYAIILLEPPLFNRSGLPFHKQLIARNMGFNKARQDVWPTLEDAMAWHKERLPWKTWHPEVMQVFSEVNFRTLPTAYHSQTEGVTAKTYKGQEAASFNSPEELYPCVDNLQSICASIPVHIIYGSRNDFWLPNFPISPWPRKLREILAETTQEYKSSLSSISVVSDAGHYVAQENPHGLAAALLQIFRDMSSKPMVKL